MPALKGKRPQLTTKEANSSRFVTKLRWIVEAIVHDVVALLSKKYKFLHNEINNRTHQILKAYVFF